MANNDTQSLNGDAVPELPESRGPAMDIFGLLAWLGVTFMASAGGLALGGDPSWYRELNQPSFAPPSWVFGPVWTVLYVLMAVAAWLVWRRVDWTRGRWPLGLYMAQLVLNAAWTGIFFGARLILPALVEMLVLLALIIATAVSFHRVQRAAAWLLAPYIAWVSFASLLTFRIWQLN